MGQCFADKEPVLQVKIDVSLITRCDANYVVRSRNYKGPAVPIFNPWLACEFKCARREILGRSGLRRVVRQWNAIGASESYELSTGLPLHARISALKNNLEICSVRSPSSN